MHEQALTGGAALAGTQEAADHGRVGGRFEVGILEHDQWPVAPHLEQQPLARGALCDPQAGGGGSDEADGGHVRVGHELIADDRARPGDEVEHSRRQVCLGDALRQQRRAVGGCRGRRPDDRVPDGQRRRHDLRGHRVRPVPGRNDRDWSDRAPQNEHPLAG